MFEQVSHQFLSFGKQAAETMLKANGIAVEGLEKVIDVQLKTIEDRVKQSANGFLRGILPGNEPHVGCDGTDLRDRHLGDRSDRPVVR